MDANEEVKARIISLVFANEIPPHRTDLFKVGDRVVWTTDERPPMQELLAEKRRQVGDGPFIIANLERVRPGLAGLAGHTQRVLLRGHTEWMSGWYFRKEETK